MGNKISEKLVCAGIFKKVSFLFPINKNTDNQSYLLGVDNKRYILKVYSSGGVEELKYELEILKKLSLDKKYNKNFLSIEKDFFLIGKRPAVIFKYINAKALSSGDINEKIIAKIAKIQAQMHKVLLRFFCTHKKLRFSIFDFSFSDIFKENIPLQYKKFLFKELKYLECESKKFLGKKYRKTTIHEDLSPDNILISKNKKIFFIDFGDSHRAEISSDIATAIKELIINIKGLNFRLVKKYLDSYQKILKLNESELKIVPFLIRRRTIFMAMYFLNKVAIKKDRENRKRAILEIKILKKISKNYIGLEKFIKKYINE